MMLTLLFAISLVFSVYLLTKQEEPSKKYRFRNLNAD